jgi:hypothetical protein
MQEYDNKAMTTKTEKVGQGNRGIKIWIGKLWLDNQDRIARTEQPGQVSLDRSG